MICCLQKNLNRCWDVQQLIVETVKRHGIGMLILSEHLRPCIKVFLGGTAIQPSDAMALLCGPSDVPIHEEDLNFHHRIFEATFCGRKIIILMVDDILCHKK